MDKLSKERSFEEVQRKLRKLIHKSPSFEDFLHQITSFPIFYLGYPVPTELRSWTKETYRQFYLDNGGQRE